MPVIKSDRFRFFALLVALVAVLSLTPTVAGAERHVPRRQLGQLRRRMSADAG